MKRNLLISLALMAMLMISTDSFGQRGRNMQQERPAVGQRNISHGISDLSPEQEAKITQLRTARMESQLQYRSQMDELSARKRSLQIQNSPDMKAINQVIDQMSTLRAQMMKDAAAHRQQVRSLLTDEQRVQFDARAQGPARGGMERRSGRMNRGVR